MKWATCDGDACTCTVLVGNGDKQPIACDKREFDVYSKCECQTEISSVGLFLIVTWVDHLIVCCLSCSDPEMLPHEGRNVPCKE